MGDKVDIYQLEKRYANFKKKHLKENKELGAKNRETILKYLRDSELGKTIKKGQKKKIGTSRNMRVAIMLVQFDTWFKHKNFYNVTEKEMEKFIEKLDTGKIKSVKGTKYKDETLMTFKKFIRKFWKYLKGEGRYYPKEVEWIDTTGKSAEIEAVKGLKSGIDRMVSFANSVDKKALIMTLFDSGARIGEFLNIRLKDVEWADEDKKSRSVRIRHSKTFPRTVGLPHATELLNQWLDIHPDRDNGEAMLFPYTSSYVSNTISRLGKKVLKTHVTPHMIRHTSATYYASRLERGSYCIRFGWSFSSRSPDRYIDRAKVNVNKTVERIHTDELSRYRKENAKLKEDFSMLQIQHSSMQKRLRQVEELTPYLDKVFTHPKIKKILDEI